MMATRGSPLQLLMFTVGLGVLASAGGTAVAAPKQTPRAPAAAASYEAKLAAQALATLDAFMTSFNARDPSAHTATYHFPHFRLARGTMNVWETRDVAMRDHERVFAALPETGWARSRWVERRIVTAGSKKVHVATRFQRLRADGSVIGTYDSLYVLTYEQGRWGVKLRSSFLP